MSVPTHNLYEFVHLVLEKQFLVKYFYEWGNKDLGNVIDLFPRATDKDMEFLNQEYASTCFARTNLPAQIFENVNWISYQPVVLCHDQEPLNFNMYLDDFVDKTIKDKWNNTEQFAITDLNLRHSEPFNFTDKWVLLHSEMNSAELTRYENTKMFVGAYWWSHALISREWYRYAEVDPRLNSRQLGNLFLVYSRDTSGSRAYRKEFLSLLEYHKLNTHCQFSSADHSSSDSAIYNWKDITSTKIHVVLETVFDDRIHLTEKTLRPIACGQPFMIANGPGTLEYLKKYGFKTFSPWIDESYDKQTDPQARMMAIVKEMQRLSKLSREELDYTVNGCYQIANHNKKLFFSNEFHNQILNELKDNVASAQKKIDLDWKQLWNNHKMRKITDPGPDWKSRRFLVLNLIKHLKKGGTLDNYIPPGSC